MTDNERLANEIVEQAYARMAEGALEPGDKVAILLARNNDNTVILTKKVEKLICKLSSSNGRPLTLVDKAKANVWPTTTILTTAGLLWFVLEKL